MDNKNVKQIIYFACYINIGNMDGDDVTKYVKKISDTVEKESTIKYGVLEKFFFIPVRQSSTTIESGETTEKSWFGNKHSDYSKDLVESNPTRVEFLYSIKL